jgi:hypothetical protein
METAKADVVCGRSFGTSEDMPRYEASAIHIRKYVIDVTSLVPKGTFSGAALVDSAISFEMTEHRPGVDLS